MAERLANPDWRGPSTIELYGSRPDENQALIQLYTQLRMARFEAEDDGKLAEFEQRLGPILAAGVRQLEEYRDQILADNPNRFLLLRIQNPGSVDLKGFVVELDVAGAVYDVTWNGQREEGITHGPFKVRVEVARIPTNFDAELRVWYRYQELSKRVFAGPKDAEWERTQGVRVRNLTAANTVIERDPSLLQNFESHHRYDVDPVVKLRSSSV